MTQEEFNKRYTFSEQDRISNCGGIGSIYRAYDNVLHREVTIKTAWTGCKAFNNKRFYLKDEYEVLKRIPKHQNIVFYDKYYCFDGSVMSYDFDGYDSDYVVMPYVFESNLSELMQRELTMEQKESIAIQLLDGLDFLHHNNVIHGNFDPWSTLIIRTQDGLAPMLTNFGLNKPIPNDFPETPSDPPYYNRAPKAGVDDKNGKSGDLIMFGIILYELFTGRPLYKDFEKPYKSYLTQMDRVDDYPPFTAYKMYWGLIKGLSEELPSPWRKVFEKCIIPENVLYDRPTNVTTKNLYDIINDYNAPELILNANDSDIGEESQLLHNIVKKIIAGKKNWTAEELQYQRNYPDTVEKALHEYRHKAEILDTVSVIHYDCTLLQLAKIAKSFGKWPRTLSFPEAVALAIIESHPLDEGTTMLILTIVGDVLDIALITIENGVYEVSYTNYVSLVSAEKIYRIWQEIRLMGSAERLFIVTTEHESFRYKTLVEELFGIEAECMDNLQQLIQRGREICAGILTGEVNNVLLLSVVSQTIGVEMEEGLMLPIVEANTSVPTKINKTLFLDANASEFNIAIWQGNMCYARDNTLVCVLSIKNQMLQPNKKRELEIVVDIDSNMRCICYLTDKYCNVTTEIALPYYRIENFNRF